MPEYVNPNSYTVHLIGQNGEKLSVRGGEKVTLDKYFDVYLSRNFLKRVSAYQMQAKPSIKKNIQAKVRLKANKTQSPQVQPKPQSNISKSADRARQKRQIINKAKKIANRHQLIPKRMGQARQQIVGRRIPVNPVELLKKNLDSSCFPISNGVGVGILSYNRVGTLARLIDSIERNTDLCRTTVFVSDDGSTNPELLKYLDELAKKSSIVLLRNKENLGVAGNSNRLLRCLSRFKYGILLNDDVEILKRGWDTFYIEAFTKTGMHHYQFRQAGIYGAELGTLINKNGCNLRRIEEKPHGAVLAFTNHMLDTCGYFNEEYGKYGLEHVDWSMKVYEYRLQDGGFFDVDCSSEYYKLHHEGSSIPDKSAHLQNARKLFADRNASKILPSENTAVPSVTYVVPFRNIDREDSIITVANNIKAQKFPFIELLMIEQDNESRINKKRLHPARYHLVQNKSGLFNKSKAFNLGVAKSSTDFLILHDADMIVGNDYTNKIYQILSEFDSCHIGGTVIYASQESTNIINMSGQVTENISLDRVVGYYEGGSIACRKKVFWKIGGFNQDFDGYGVEDCDFYTRLSQGSNWKEDRKVDLLHLWHSRVSGWNAHHENNKTIERALSRLSIDQRIKLQHAQLKAFGYDDFLV